METISGDDIIAASLSGNSVCHWTMIADYDPATHVFTRTDGAVTAFMEIDPIAALDAADATLATYAEVLARALSAVQPGDLVSYHVLRSRHLSQEIEAYRGAIGRPLELLQLWRTTRANFIQAGIDTPLLTRVGNGGGLFTRKLRIIVGLTIPPAMEPGGIGGSLLDALGLRAADQRSQRRFQAARAALVERLLERITTITDHLTVLGCKRRHLDANGYLSLVREMLYPRWDGRMRELDARLPLYAQLPIADVVVDPRRGHLLADGICIKAATVRGHPAAVHPGMLSLPHRLLAGHSLLDGLEAGWMSVTARAVGKEGTRFALQNLTTNLRGGFILPGHTAEVLADAARAQTWLEAEGRRFFEVETVVAVWGDTVADADVRLRRVCEQFSDVVAPTERECHAAPAFIVRGLPGNAAPPAASLDRRVVMVDRQLADLLPVYARSRGTAEALMMLHGPGGDLFPFSPWGGSAQGTLVAGQSGQGKSVLVQCLALDLLCQADAQVIVFDIGRSYLTLCLLFGEQAQYLDCGRSQCCINPLAGTQAANGLSALGFLEAACSRPGSSPLSASQIGILSSALNELYESHQEVTTFLAREELGDPAGIVRAVKVLRTTFVTETHQRQLAAGGHDGIRTVWYRYRVVAVVVARSAGSAGSAKSAGARLAISSGRELPIGIGVWLRGMGIVWSDDADGCVLTASSALLTATLRGQGITAVLDDTCSQVEVTTEEDAMHLASMGIAVLVPDALSGQPQQEPGPREVYRATVGEACIQRDVRLSDLGRLLEERYAGETSGDGQDLIQRLQPYYGGRAYARFVDGPTTVALSGTLLVVFELEALLSGTDPHVCALVVAALLHHVSSVCAGAQPTPRPRRTMVIIEEAAQLIGSARPPAAGAGRGGAGVRDGQALIGERIDTLFRSGRTHGVAVTLVTQGVSDLIGHPLGAAMLEQCVIKLILAQSETAVARIAKALRLTPEQTAMLSGLRSRSGHYSQVLVISNEHEPRIFDIALHILHPIQYWMTTTRRDEVLLREAIYTSDPHRHHQHGQARLRAVLRCALDYPRGLGRS